MRASASSIGSKGLQRGPLVAERVEVLGPGDEQEPAPLLGDELDEVLHLRGAQEAGVGVAEQDDVVGEEVFLGGGEGGQRRPVLLAVLGVGREQDDAQVDRLLALEEVLQVADTRSAARRRRAGP